MNEEKMLKVLDTLGQVKEEFIQEAAPNGIDTATKNNKLIRWAKWGALAACLCIIAGIGIKTLLPQDEVYTADNIKTDVTTTEEDYMKNDSNTTAPNHTVGTTETVIDTSMDEGFPNWGLELSVKNVTSTGLTLVVTQSGGEPSGELQTGEAYRLMALVDGTWKNVEELPLPEGVDGRGWNSIAYLLPKGESREFEVDWNWIFGELPSGTYRFIKGFMDFRKTADYDTFEYWVEFEIQ